MLFNLKSFYCKLSIRTIVLPTFIMLTPFQVFAVQPMSESDLQVVSATTGDNILNIFGASQAGLKVDDSDFESYATGNTQDTSIQLENERFNEGEETTPVAMEALKTIEKDSLNIANTSNALMISTDTQATIIKINKQTTGNTSAFTTNSEISYKTDNVHHDMREIENGGVAVSRDLQIDSLRIENLRGAHLDESRSAGNIYLSDWRSQGDTRIITTK